MKPLSILLGVVIIGGTGLLGYGIGLFDSGPSPTISSNMVASSSIASPVKSMADEEVNADSQKEDSGSGRRELFGGSKSDTNQKPTMDASAEKNSDSNKANVGSEKPFAANRNSASKRKPLKPVANASAGGSSAKSDAVGKTSGEVVQEPARRFRGPQALSSEVGNQDANLVARPQVQPNPNDLPRRGNQNVGLQPVPNASAAVEAQNDIPRAAAQGNADVVARGNARAAVPKRNGNGDGIQQLSVAREKAMGNNAKGKVDGDGVGLLTPPPLEIPRSYRFQHRRPNRAGASNNNRVQPNDQRVKAQPNRRKGSDPGVAMDVTEVPNNPRKKKSNPQNNKPVRPGSNGDGIQQLQNEPGGLELPPLGPGPFRGRAQRNRARGNGGTGIQQLDNKSESGGEVENSDKPSDPKTAFLPSNADYNVKRATYNSSSQSSSSSSYESDMEMLRQKFDRLRRKYNAVSK